MKEYDPKRRIVVRSVITAGCVLAVPALLTGCSQDDAPPASPDDAPSASQDDAPSASPDNEAGKMSQEQAEYQDHPEGDERCGNCRFFVAEDNTCEVVAGEISPDGWCKLWVEEA